VSTAGTHRVDAPPGALRVRQISAEEQLAVVAERGASFLQCPSWAAVKTGWGSERLGWVHGEGADERVVGSALVLYRALPGLRRYLAYVPEGPVIDWSDHDLARWLDPLLAHLRGRKAFTVKMGPPVVARRWQAATVKAAIADGSAHRLADVPPDDTDPTAERVTSHLRDTGWGQQPGGGGGFGDVQPRYVFWLPLTGRGEDDVLAGFNQQWRRNLRKADKAGVSTERGTAADLADFHALYLETAARDGFTGRPLSYFQGMWDAMTGEDPDRLRLYLARHDGELLAATLMVHVGEHVWYSYGASSTRKREVQASNAVQWQMIRDALSSGAAVYDLRGIGDSLDEDHRLFGLIRFKLGTGGEAVEYVGEWDKALNSLLHKAFALYLKRR
jgi:lipid II:glycine glycyltransferase (peptidoglycan interpeptide bridge formation enzyme)